MGIIQPANAAAAKVPAKTTPKKDAEISLSFVRDPEEIKAAQELEKQIAQRNHAHTFKLREQNAHVEATLAQWRSSQLKDPNVNPLEKARIRAHMEKQKNQKIAHLDAVQSRPMQELIKCAAIEKELFVRLRGYLVYGYDSRFIRYFQLCDKETQKRLAALPQSPCYEVGRASQRYSYDHRPFKRNEDCDLIRHIDHGAIGHSDTSDDEDQALALNDLYKRSLLHYASIFCRDKPIDTLLAVGANPLTFDTTQALPLYAAIKSYDEKSVTSLLNAMPNLLVAVKYRKSALSCLAFQAHSNREPKDVLAMQNQMRAIINRMKKESDNYSEADVHREVKRALAITVEDETTYNNTTINLLMEHLVDMLAEIKKGMNLLSWITYHADRDKEPDTITAMREQIRAIIERLDKNKKYSKDAILRAISVAIKIAEEKENDVIPDVTVDLKTYRAHMTLELARTLSQQKKAAAPPVPLTATKPVDALVLPANSSTVLTAAAEPVIKLSKKDRARFKAEKEKAEEEAKEARLKAREQQLKEEQAKAAVPGVPSEEPNKANNQQAPTPIASAAPAKAIPAVPQPTDASTAYEEHQRLLALALVDTKVCKEGKPQEFRKKEKTHTKKNKSKSQLKKEKRAAELTAKASAKNVPQPVQDLGPRLPKAVEQREKKAMQAAVTKMNAKLLAQQTLREQLAQAEKEKQKAEQYEKRKKSKKADKREGKRERGGLQSVQELVHEGKMSMEAITYMRGRSIPYQFILIDEVQNLTPHEVKTLITRVGEGSKIILAGDPYQIDSPYLDFASNGLVIASERFKGQGLFGSVFLEHSERSELSQLAGKLL